jgi:hypothetical protein
MWVMTWMRARTHRGHVEPMMKSYQKAEKARTFAIFASRPKSGRGALPHSPQLLWPCGEKHQLHCSAMEYSFSVWLGDHSASLQRSFEIVVSWVSMITPSKEKLQMIARHKLAAAFAVAAVIFGIGGGIVATHAVGNAGPPAPAVQGPNNSPAVDLPEPGDVPDGPGE